MYYVISWDSREVLDQCDKLSTAKKIARNYGHTGENNPILTGYPPVAYVSNENREVVYNPRFKKDK